MRKSYKKMSKNKPTRLIASARRQQQPDQPGLRPKSIPPLQFPRSKTVKVGAGKGPLCLLCRIISQIPLQRLVADLLTVSLTSSQQVRIKGVRYNKLAASASTGSYGETRVMYFGHNCSQKCPHFLETLKPSSSAFDVRPE